MKYLNGKQTVKSMRSSGYRSADYAVAELIDNSIQAGATDVVLIVVEKELVAKDRLTVRATEIWVLDNGSGMDRDLAQAAVSFGGSDRYDDRSGMGRFGMGLPQASVSQCKRTDLWTWQNSDPRDALAVRIDLDEIEHGVDEVPPAVGPGQAGYESLPDWVLKIYEDYISRKTVAGREATPSGTAIRWRDLDRVQWVKATTILGHVEFLLGRIYRRFLTGQARDPQTNKPVKVNIKVVVLDDANLSDPGEDLGKIRKIRPNDPMHLSVPREDVLEYFEKGNPDYAPNASDEENRDQQGNPVPPLIRVDNVPPFKEHHPQKRFDIVGADGKTYGVIVRTSRVTADGRPVTVEKAGSKTRQGRHFAGNRGVSIVRADREVTMDETFYYDAPDRFWSVEVSFPPALDEVFGVTNNKQDVPHFKEICRGILRRAENGDETPLAASGDADGDLDLAKLEEVARYVRSQIGLMRGENKAENEVRRSNAKGRLGLSALADAQVDVALQVKKHLSGKLPTKGEQEAAREEEGKSDDERQKAREARAARAVAAAKNSGISGADAEAIGSNYMKGLTYQVVDTRQGQAHSFFWPEEYGDLDIVYMNTAHPAHSELLAVLRLEDGKINALSEEEAKVLLGRAADALGWLIHGWVRMEVNLGSDAEYVEHVRTEWGRHLKGILGAPPFKPISELIESIDDEDDW